VTFLFALNEEMIIQIYEMGVMTGMNLNLPCLAIFLYESMWND
jgi:hypothetical protein